MKQLLIAVTFLLPVLTFAQSETKIIEADIRGRSCSGGLGLCTLQPPALSGRTLSSTKPTVKIVAPNIFVLQIGKNQISESQKKTITANGTSPSFNQEADYTIDNATLLYLGLENKFNLLQAGFYPMTETEDTFSITFTLMSN